MQTLEVRLREAALKNAALLQENDVLRKHVTTLETEVYIYTCSVYDTQAVSKT